MQETVSKSATKKLFQMPIKSIFTLILIILFLFVILLVLASSRKSEKLFDEETYYFVYVEKKKNTIKKDKIDLIKSLGGAGDVYLKSGRFYLLANVYLEKEDAEEIAEGFLENFESAGVLSLTAPDIESSVKQKIKDEPNVYAFFRKFYDVLEKTEQLNMKYISGLISDGELMSEFIANKLEFENLSKEISKVASEKLYDDINTYVKQIVNLYNDFFDNFYTSTKKISLTCSLFVNLVLTKINLFQNL